jgi:flagellar basal-body rod modification protein FlgD
MATSAASSMMSLNPSAFLNMFVTQLKNQDPTSPMDSSQMTTVLAQLTQVQSLSNLQTSFQKSLAQGMIGETVTYTSGSQSKTGQVQASLIQDGQVGVVVGGQFITLDSITQVQPTPTASVKES